MHEHPASMMVKIPGTSIVLHTIQLKCIIISGIISFTNKSTDIKSVPISHNSSPSTKRTTIKNPEEKIIHQVFGSNFSIHPGCDISSEWKLQFISRVAVDTI